VKPARKVPIALKEKVSTALKKMVKKGVLAKVDTPTDWVNQMAVQEKKSGDVRICLDPRSLNEVLKREQYVLPVIDDILPKLVNAKVFTKLDLRNGYWHLKLDEKSSYLTTFITDSGRYRWLRLPFGLSVSSEIFQKRLHQALEGLDGVVCVADDIVVYGCGDNPDEATKDHDQKLIDVLKRCREIGIKLSKEKAEIRKEKITFLGHEVTSEGLRVDEGKVKAITELPAPENKQDIQVLLGTVNYLAKFLPNLSQVMEPVRQLLADGV
jgi:hypothetical protein